MSEFSKDKLELLRKKDAYPYKWVDCYIQFLYPRLPPKEVFYSSIDDGKEVKEMDIFLMNNIYIQKTFGILLILKHLKIFIIIT